MQHHKFTPFASTARYWYFYWVMLLRYIQARIKSFGHAINGIRVAIASQQNMRIHLVAVVVVVAASFACKLNATEWALVAFAIGLVWATELMNTVVETVLDVLHPAHHPKVGLAKDIAAGAVLIAAITAVLIAVLVFGKHFV